MSGSIDTPQRHADDMKGIVARLFFLFASLSAGIAALIPLISGGQIHGDLYIPAKGDA